MNLEQHFSVLLETQTPDLGQSQKKWDRRADEVSRFTVQNDDVALNKILQRHRLDGERVLEISFGGGRHLLEFARRGAQVSGVEISPNMIGHAQKKLRDAGLQERVQSLVCAPWQTLLLADHGWQGAFDLVFLYMSPAISSAAMLQKALEASRAGLYLALYTHRQDSLLTQLQDELGLPRRSAGSKSENDIYAVFNLLYQWGYFPDVGFEERKKTRHYDIDYILQRYASWLWSHRVDDDKCRQLRQMLERKAVDGKVPNYSYDMVGHLYVDKRTKRRG